MFNSGKPVYDVDTFEFRRNKNKTKEREDGLSLAPDICLMAIQGRFRLQAVGAHWRHSHARNVCAYVIRVQETIANDLRETSGYIKGHLFSQTLPMQLKYMQTYIRLMFI